MNEYEYYEAVIRADERKKVLDEAIKKVDEYWLNDSYLVSCIKGDLEQMKGEEA